ncbi:hypothetical protein VNO78_23471 [Psophocarpus tetragonolobus]|uniref:Uncharacterized protein n=1 Tax=Psophocarpus tetragonolobus TaxID=3891 RepID=A0AAN9XEG8_PSOTE
MRVWPSCSSGRRRRRRDGDYGTASLYEVDEVLVEKGEELGEGDVIVNHDTFFQDEASDDRENELGNRKGGEGEGEVGDGEVGRGSGVEGGISAVVLFYYVKEQSHLEVKGVRECQKCAVLLGVMKPWVAAATHSHSLCGGGSGNTCC